MSSSTDRARAVVLALLMVGSVFGATIAFTGGAAATINTDSNVTNATDVTAGYSDTQWINVSADDVPTGGNVSFDINVSNVTDEGVSPSDISVNSTRAYSGTSTEGSKYYSDNTTVKLTLNDTSSSGSVSGGVSIDLDLSSVSPTQSVNYNISQYNSTSDPTFNDSHVVTFDVVERVSSAGHPEDLQRNETTQNLTANGNISITNVDANDAVVYVNMTTLDDNGVDVDSLSAPSDGDVTVSGGTYSGDGSVTTTSDHTVMILTIKDISGNSFNITKLVTGGELDVSQASITDGLTYSIAATEGTTTSDRFVPGNDGYTYEGPAYGVSDTFAITEVTDASYIEQSTDNVTTAGANATVNVTFVDDAGVNENTINVSVSDARNDTTQLVRNGQLVNGTFEKSTIDDTNSTVEKAYVSINLSDGVYTINASAMDNESNPNPVGNSPTTFGSNSDPAFDVSTTEYSGNHPENAGNVDSLILDPDSGAVNQEIVASATISTTGKDTSFALDLNDDGLINESEVVVTATDDGTKDQTDNDGVVNVTLDLGNYSLSGMDNVSVLAIGEDGDDDEDDTYAFGDLVVPDRTATYNITGDNTGPIFAESTNDVAAGENVTVNVSVMDAENSVDNSTINVSVTNSTGTTYSLVENGAATDDSSIVAVVDPSSFNDSETEQTETVNITADLPEGAYTINASASDTLGNSNESDSVGDGFTVGSPDTGPDTTVDNIDVSLNRTKLVADNETVIEATANVTNASDDPVSGVVLDRTIENGSDTAANVTVLSDFAETNGDGVSTLTLVANTSGYTVTVNATNGSVSGNASFGTIPTSPTYNTTSEVATYDSDNDGTISSTELQSAAADFRGGSLDMSQLQDAAAAFAS